jgi:predicted RND superfamily exporter protein
MHSVLAKVNRFFERAPNVLIRWRWLVLLTFVALTAVLMYGMITRFQMEMSLESWFRQDDPIKLSLDDFRAQFGSDDGVYVVYKTRDGDVFSEKSIATLKAFHEALDQIRLGLKPLREGAGDDASPMLQRILKIDSLLNARYQVADGDTLITRKLLAQDYPQTEIEREQKRTLAASQETFELAFYSKDYAYGGLRLKTDFGVVPMQATTAPAQEDLLAEDDFSLAPRDSVQGALQQQKVDYQDMQMEEYLAFMKDIRELASRPEFDHFEFHFTGNAPMMEFAMGNMVTVSMLLGLMILVVMGLLWFLFRSISAVVWPILVIVCSAFWAFGIVSWLDLKLSMMISFSFMLILAAGVADCVHILSAYLYFRREGFDHREAMTKAYRKTGIPVFLTSFTTALGMLSLTVSEIPHIRVFGFSAALGVVIAFLFTIFVLPVLLDIWHPYNKKAIKRAESKGNSQWLQRRLDKIPALVGRRAKFIVVFYFSVFGLFVYGATQVRVDSNLAELTKETSWFRVSYDLVDKHMMGAQNMEFMLDFGSRDALKDPDVLKAIDRLQTQIEKNYPRFVKKSFSLADFVKDTNLVLHEGRPEFKVIPDDPHLTAQLLYLFDNANPDDRRDMVSDDYARSHITVTLTNAGSFEYTDFFAAMQHDLHEVFEPLQTKYPQMKVSITGSLALMMELVDYISWTQIQSFGLALLTITLTLMFTLGTLQAGFIAILPNLLPAFFTVGLMGLFDIALDIDTLIIAPLIIGIAVDDTIHFMAHYRDAWYELGDVEKALQSTIKEVGQAVVFTSVILGLGFSMLAFSDYLGHAKTGIFGSLAIFVALSADLFLLPAVIKWLRPDLGRTEYLAKKSAKVVAA